MLHVSLRPVALFQCLHRLVFNLLPECRNARLNRLFPLPSFWSLAIYIYTGAEWIAEVAVFLKPRDGDTSSKYCKLVIKNWIEAGTVWLQKCFILEAAFNTEVVKGWGVGGGKSSDSSPLNSLLPPFSLNFSLSPSHPSPGTCLIPKLWSRDQAIK